MKSNSFTKRNYPLDILLGILLFLAAVITLPFWVITAIQLLFLSPLILLGLVIWFCIWHKRTAKPRRQKRQIRKEVPKNLRMLKMPTIKINGVDTPIGVVIFTVVLTILILVLTVFSVLFLVPMWLFVVIATAAILTSNIKRR